MGWKETLTKKIEALKDEDFKYEYVTVPNGKSFKTKSASIEVEATSVECLGLRSLMGGVNGASTCGMARGKILLTGLAINPDGCCIRVSIRNSTPWNNIYSNAAGSFEEFHGSDGSTPYPYVDFNRSIPE